MKLTEEEQEKIKTKLKEFCKIVNGMYTEQEYVPDKTKKICSCELLGKDLPELDISLEPDEKEHLIRINNNQISQVEITKPLIGIDPIKPIMTEGNKVALVIATQESYTEIADTGELYTSDRKKPKQPKEEIIGK